MKPPVIVIQCGEAKRDEPAPARDLYVGQPFVMARDAAERDGRPWLILSARHGLVPPNRILAPYDRVLRTRAHKVTLSRWVAGQQPPRSVESWCSRHYSDVLRWAGVSVEEPLAGVGIGDRYSWWAAHAVAEVMA